MAGKHLAKPIDENNEAFYISNLRLAANRLAAEGIIGLIEPINKYSVPGYYLNNYEHAVDVLKSVNSDNLKLMMDLFHLQLIRGNIINSFKELGSYIGHVQIAQAPHRHEPDVEGEVNFKFVLEKLQRDAGYDGWVGCEYRPLKGSAEGLKWITNFGYEL